MKKLFIITLLSICFTCQKENIKIVKADLTFKSISLASTYGVSDDQVVKFNNYLDNIKEKNSPNKSEIDLLNYFSKLKKNNLAHLPYIFIQINKDSSITVHLTEKQYDKIKNYKHIDLFKRKKKIELELEIKQIDSSIFFSENILKISEVVGRSHSSK